MATITLEGNAIHTIDQLPSIGRQAKDFELIASDLSTKTLADFKGEKIIISAFPSIDTPVCATSVRIFSEIQAKEQGIRVLYVSRDLPFAQARFCQNENLTHATMLSDFKTGAFGKDYGLEITDSVLEGLHSRSIIAIDRDGTVVYTEQVAEIVEEPNYSAAIESLQ